MTKEEREVMRMALEAMNLAGGNLCETLNHSKKLQHKIGEPCPAVAKFDAAITAIEKCLANDAVDCEPVVWMYQNKSTHEVRFQKYMRSFVDHSKTSEVPLYSEPLANQEKTSGSPIKQVLAKSEQEPVALKRGECWPEDVMKMWDFYRKEIANGNTGSEPRDWFESLAEMRLVDITPPQRNKD